MSDTTATPSSEPSSEPSQTVPEPDASTLGAEAEPDTQGSDPLEADLGEDGQGDMAEGEDGAHSGDAPDDLRVEELP